MAVSEPWKSKSLKLFPKKSATHCQKITKCLMNTKPFTSCTWSPDVKLFWPALTTAVCWLIRNGRCKKHGDLLKDGFAFHSYFFILPRCVGTIKAMQPKRGGGESPLATVMVFLSSPHSYHTLTRKHGSRPRKETWWIPSASSLTGNLVALDCLHIHRWHASSLHSTGQVFSELSILAIEGMQTLQCP